jgi:hypothetical protein
MRLTSKYNDLSYFCFKRAATSLTIKQFSCTTLALIVMLFISRSVIDLQILTVATKAQLH